MPRRVSLWPFASFLRHIWLFSVVCSIAVGAVFQLYLGRLAHSSSGDSPWLLRRHGAEENTLREGCHIAIVSTYLPQRCGIAEFSDKLIAAMQQSTQFRGRCSIEVFSLVSPMIVKNTSLWLLEKEDPTVPVTYIKMDRHTPSKAIWEAVQRMRQQHVTHCVLQQEYGLTPTMWQLADLARWLPASISLVTVVHSPHSHPNIEELGVIRRCISIRMHACSHLSPRTIQLHACMLGKGVRITHPYICSHAP
jgi:hypothetical protein